jgi:hypothetical protein
MSAAKERDSKAAEEMRSKLEDREEARLEAERSTLKGLNQGMENPASQDTTHRGIRWGPSYRSRRKARKKSEGPETQAEKKDGEEKA